MHVIEKHLKSCPFCGGRAKLKTDQFAMNEAYNYYKIFCTECGVSGRMFLDGPTMAFNGHPSRIVPPEEAIRRAADAWNHRESDDRRTQEEQKREVFCNSLAADEAAPMMEAIRLYQYSNCDELRFCGNMARLYGCIPLDNDGDNLLNFLCTLYHYGQVQGIRAERARRKGGEQS